MLIFIKSLGDRAISLMAALGKAVITIEEKTLLFFCCNLLSPQPLTWYSYNYYSVFKWFN
jgi:hypothetical protein